MCTKKWPDLNKTFSCITNNPNYVLLISTL